MEIFAKTNICGKSEKRLGVVLIWFWVSILLLPQLNAKLIGDHICQTEITVPQEVLKWELKNRTQRTYKWCMSVPPRCSFYSYQIVNETVKQVINTTKSVDACCEGFNEQNNVCISDCQNCQKGLCIKGTCVCQKGWTGSQCDTNEYSTTSKTTIETSIHSTSTTLPLDTSSLTDTPPEATEIFTKSLQKEDLFISSSTTLNQNTDSTSDEIFHNTLSPEVTKSTIWKIPELDKTHNNIIEFHNVTTVKDKNFIKDSTMIHPSEEKILKYYKSYFTTTTKIHFLHTTSSEEVEGSGSKYRFRMEQDSSEISPDFKSTADNQPSSVFIENAQFPDSKEEEGYREIGEVNSEDDIGNRKLTKNIFEESYGNNSLSDTHSRENLITHNSLNVLTTAKSTQVLSKPSTLSVEEHSEENHEVIKENLLRDVDDFVGERYEKQPSTMENTRVNSAEPINKNLIYTICAASLTTFLILVVVVTMYAVRNSRKKMENRTKEDIATVAVYTTSIFHSPLPEPPTFDNPTYLASPACVNTIRGSGCSPAEKDQAIEVQELNVTFLKPVKNPNIDPKPYVYDHPPSTGSYRATSQVDTLSQYNISQRSFPEMVFEPLYQEIPSKAIYANGDYVRSGEEIRLEDGCHQDVNRSVDANCLYMNTCGRTKF